MNFDLIYIDPGSGSYFFQMLIGAILGGAYVCKIYFYQIKEKIKKMISGFKKNSK
ncbi:hypothetical protein [Sediminibacterium sp.]|uniref:hypothetical protein n=1 Tax=Sediminibacterium sp. TaxID=1917865 RepID=UPI0025D3FD62|nr:hypothetical protein [Sediminibacterium sp.]